MGREAENLLSTVEPRGIQSGSRRTQKQTDGYRCTDVSTAMIRYSTFIPWLTLRLGAMDRPCDGHTRRTQCLDPGFQIPLLGLVAEAADSRVGAYKTR